MFWEYICQFHISMAVNLASPDIHLLIQEKAYLAKGSQTQLGKINSFLASKNEANQMHTKDLPTTISKLKVFHRSIHLGLKAFNSCLSKSMDTWTFSRSPWNAPHQCRYSSFPSKSQHRFLPWKLHALYHLSEELGQAFKIPSLSLITIRNIASKGWHQPWKLERSLNGSLTCPPISALHFFTLP